MRRLFDPARFARALRHHTGRRAGALRTFAQNVVHVIQIGGQFSAPGTCDGEVVPVVFEQRLLEVTVAETTGRGQPSFVRTAED